MRYVLTLLFILSSLSALAQTESIQYSPQLVDAPPKGAGMSADRLSRIDTMFEEAIRENQIPGAVAIVTRNGKIVYHKAFGMADNRAGRELKKDDIFRIASQTKAVTATAVMMLWEEGKFRLDDPVSNYIPEFSDARVLDSFNAQDSTFTTVPAENPITIRHLLTHTSGIGYGIIDRDERFRKIYQKAGITDLFTTRDITIEENVKKLSALPLHHNPGEKYTYSKGLDVLGYFIEVISGRSLDSFFQTRIFEPLGMDDTWFYLPESEHDRLVTVQQKEGAGWVSYASQYYDPEYPRSGAKQFLSGGAGLSGTAKDYATFLQMYLNGGELNGIRLLSRTTVNFMMKNQVGDLIENPGRGYGLAFGIINQEGVKTGGLGSLGTFDWGGYFNTQYFADPKENVIGVLYKQTRGPTGDDTAWKFRQLVGQAIDD